MSVALPTSKICRIGHPCEGITPGEAPENHPTSQEDRTPGTKGAGGLVPMGGQGSTNIRKGASLGGVAAHKPRTYEVRMDVLADVARLK